MMKRKGNLCVYTYIYTHILSFINLYFNFLHKWFEYKQKAQRCNFFRLMGFVVAEYEKFTDMILDLTLQLTFKKLPLVWNGINYMVKDSN